MSVYPFTPQITGGKGLSVTATTGRVALGLGHSVVISNLGADYCYIEFGDVTIEAAVTTGFCVLPYTQVILRRNSAQTYLAAICDSGDTCTLRIHTGDGE